MRKFSVKKESKNNNSIGIKKGQSATEFMILVGAMLFFFAAFLSALYYNVGDRTREKTKIDFQQVETNVQNELNLASGASDGYSRTFNIPDKVDGLDYTINITADSLYLRAGNEFAESIAIPLVDGNLTFGPNRIANINGTIYLNRLPS